MAPTLNSAYSKDLSEFPHSGETRVSHYGFLINEASLFKISEITIVNPEDDIVLYTLIEKVGAFDQEQLMEFVLDRADKEISEEDIIKELLTSEIIDESKNTVAGRIALREYSFIEENGDEVNSYQVAGVETVKTIRQRGLCYRTYLFLLHWYTHLVCDDTQTIPGAKIWAGPLMRTGDVRIYNAKTTKFEDVLGEFGVGKNTGLIPWNRGKLLDMELSTWNPNRIQITVQKFIVLVISRCSRIPVGLKIE